MIPSEFQGNLVSPQIEASAPLSDGIDGIMVCVHADPVRDHVVVIHDVVLLILPTGSGVMVRDTVWVG